MASFDDHRSVALPTELDALSLSRLSNITLNTTQDEQQPPIFRTAAELRNCIYELAIPTSTTILLRVENVTAASKPTIRFHPALPPLHYVCRRTHNECPLYQYYTNNTFLFADDMLRLRILDALVATRGDIIKAITSVKVTLVTGSIEEVGESHRKITIRFTLTKSPSTGAVDVKDLRVTSRSSQHENLCFCGTLYGAQQGDGSVFGTLRTFVARFESVAHASTSSSDSFTEKHCNQCGKKTICTRLRSQNSVGQADPRVQHDRGPVQPATDPYDKATWMAMVSLPIMRNSESDPRDDFQLREEFQEAPSGAERRQDESGKDVLHRELHGTRA
ncbi:hypothetical protein LTR97_009536 [Elasticomyces elasticus]|uniref:Uncharacterized protein n=1 Tax=Elasticomyces elasticus TaxID=574655 RepID=A0AAN7VMS1_9PEZI|nr:hypothetical protein LTR97_009536 [Elasticomyces elasticus]